MLLFGHDETVADWAAGHIAHVSDFGPCSAIGVISGDRLIAGIVYHDYQPMFGTIQLSMAAISPMWARKDNVQRLLEYPFKQLGCYKVFTATPADNEKAIKVNAHIGFKREAILAHHFGKKRHGVIMRMILPDYDRLFGES